MFRVTIEHRCFDCDYFGLRHFIADYKSLLLTLDDDALTHHDFNTLFPNARVTDLYNHWDVISGFLIDKKQCLAYDCESHEVLHVTHKMFRQLCQTSTVRVHRL